MNWYYYQLFSEVIVAKKRYEVGLEKLASAAAEISVMGENLKKLQPALLQASDDVRQTVTKVDKEKEDVAKVRYYFQFYWFIINW